jgi:hypothetical protein
MISGLILGHGQMLATRDSGGSGNLKQLPAGRNAAQGNAGGPAQIHRVPEQRPANRRLREAEPDQARRSGSQIPLLTTKITRAVLPTEGRP